MTSGLEPIRTAVVHPVDTPSLLGAVEAARARLIVPVLVGPEVKIRAAAAQAQLDLTPYEIVPTEHSEAAAEQAVAMARAGKVEALMKGALHTDELMHAVVAGDRGLRTARRISHVFAIDAPGYPKPLFVTDAAINVYPTLEEKRDIIQNAIDLVHALGDRGTACSDPVCGRNGYGQAQIHPRRRRALQDGRSPPIHHRRHSRWAAWFRQCRLRGGG